MRKKQQTTEHEDSPDHIILHHDSPDHIILHHAPAALLAEKNLIHLNAGLSLFGSFFGVICSVFG